MSGLVGYLVGNQRPNPNEKLLRYKSQYPSANFSSIPELSMKNSSVSSATKAIHLQTIRSNVSNRGTDPSLSTMLPRHSAPAGFPGMDVIPNSTISYHVNDQFNQQSGRHGTIGGGRLLTR